jgi:filamentous hemagglutinin
MGLSSPLANAATHTSGKTRIATGGKLTLTAGEGVVLGAVEIKSTGSTDIDSPDVQFVAEKNLDYLSHTEWDTNLVYGVHEGHGHVEETLTLTRIDAQGGLNLPGNAHISVQLDADQTTYTAAELRDLAVTLSSQPGLAWLNELSKRPDVDWQAIATAHQNWNYKQQGLTGVGAAGATTTTWGSFALANTTAAGVTTYTAAGRKNSTPATIAATVPCSSQEM